MALSKHPGTAVDDDKCAKFKILPIDQIYSKKKLREYVNFFLLM